MVCFMKRLRLWLALLFASISSLQGAYAVDIKEPVMPLDFAKFDVNETYYLYNVKTGNLIGSQQDALDAGRMYDLIESNGSFHLRMTYDGGQWYLGRNANYTYTIHYTYSSDNTLWKLNCVDADKNHYTFSWYDASISDSLYLGYGSDDVLNHRFTVEENTVWAFLPEAPHSRYIALKELYDLLVNNELYDFLDYDTKYMELYDDPNSTAEDIKSVTNEINRGLSFKNFTASSEVPIWITCKENNEEEWVFSSSNIKYRILPNTSTKLSLTFKTNDVTQFCYKPSYDQYNYVDVNVYVDGKLTRSYNSEQLKEYNNTNGMYLHMEKGLHHVDIEYICKDPSSSRYIYMHALSAMECPKVSVSLLEPGSLGTEVLYYVNHLKDVRNLKIKGAMNDDDWAKIDMMTSLQMLDLSEADITVIPDKKFSSSKISRFVLPENLKTIGESAFYRCVDEDLVIPESVTQIKNSAFMSSRIKNVNIPNVNSLGSNAFERCLLLTDLTLSENIGEIPYYCFYNCLYLKSINGGIYLPASVKKIGQNAFHNCYRLNLRFHEGITTFGDRAVYNTAIDTLIVPESVSDYGEYFAEYSRNLKYAEFPTSFCETIGSYNAVALLQNCKNIETVVFKSPTVVGGDRYTTILNGLSAEQKSNVTLRVPSYLVNAYKLDEYWYNFKIEGFDTEEIKDWTIKKDLTLYARDRFKGNPDMTLTMSGGLNILGETGMDVNNLVVQTNYSSSSGNGARFISHNDGVKINGKLQVDYYTSALKWHFISLPFDIKVSEIEPATGMKYAIRYYDGASRAQNGAKGNWKNYEADDIIEAGTGFIYQTSVAGWTHFYPMDDESKQNIASNKMFVKALEANPSDVRSNKGWNLVGNPWQAYFNNHSVNFTAPITVWNGTTYVAYSLIDDDYAIKPNEAFFVQCPEEINSISFPITGRQLTSEITNQSGAKPRMFGANLENRQLIDLSVAKGDLMDKTRVVVNEGASADYETGVDASKFFSMDGTVPQVYTLVGEATECAINERPVAEGLVKVGFMAPEDGCYTFALVRNEAKTVMLIDHETGTTTDLTAGEYNFTAAQGTWNNRFELMITPAEPTAIVGVDGNKDTKVAATGEGIVVEGTEGRVVVYSVDGKKVAEQPVDGTATISVAKGTYLVRTAKGTAKVTVR